MTEAPRTKLGTLLPLLFCSGEGGDSNLRIHIPKLNSVLLPTSYVRMCVFVSLACSFARSKSFKCSRYVERGSRPTDRPYAQFGKSLHRSGCHFAQKSLTDLTGRGRIATLNLDFFSGFQSKSRKIDVFRPILNSPLLFFFAILAAS